MGGHAPHLDRAKSRLPDTVVGAIAPLTLCSTEPVEGKIDGA